MRCEFQKLRRPLVYAGSFLAVVLIGLLMTQYQQAAQGAYEPWLADIHRLEALCINDPSASECETGGERESARQQANYVAEDYPLAESMQDPVAIGGVVAGHVSSLLGFAVLAAVGTGYAGGEWSSRTMPVLLARDPRRWRVVLVEFLTLLTFGVFLLAVTWLVASAFSFGFVRMYSSVPPSTAAFDGSWTIQQLCRAVFSVAFFAAVVVTIAHAARSVFGTMASLVAGAAAAFGVTLLPVISNASPVAWIAGWMGFRGSTQLGDHLWVDRFPLLSESPSPLLHEWLAGCLLAVAILLSLVSATILLQRRDIDASL